MPGPLDALDDPDYPAYTTGRAAEVLGVRQAFLRSLDAAGAVRPVRTEGGRRRYSRRQLAFAARIRQLLDQGHTLAAARRILDLEDDLAAERGPVQADGAQMIVAERPYGTFTRQVFLGETLDADSIAADYAAGVLTLTIPVREQAKPRSIQVTSSDTKQAVTA